MFSGMIASTGSASAQLCPPGTGIASCGGYALPGDSRATFTPKKRFDLSPRADLLPGGSNTLSLRITASDLVVQNNGIGGLVLPSAAYLTRSHFNDLTLDDTQTFGSRLVNNVHLDLYRRRASQVPVSTNPLLTVVGSFTAGGSPDGDQSSTADQVEATDAATLQWGTHLNHYGGRLRSYRLAQHSTAGANGSFFYRTIADYLNNQPFQYSVTSYSNDRVSARTTNLALYGEDEWRSRPNLTIAYGLRFEAQGAIHSGADLAPRLSLNYAIPRKAGPPQTTLRLGYGVFYQRFGIDQIVNSVRLNGVNLAERLSRASGLGVLAGCSPLAISPCGSGITSPNTVHALSANLRSAYLSQVSFSVEQQLAAHTVVFATYLLRRGVHQYFSTSLPTGGGDLRYEYQSGGYMRHGQLVLNARTQL